MVKGKRATLSDVAKSSNVSKSTVSQYLNHRYEYMSAETKARIEAAIDELGYQPNILARSLKQKTTATIGVIVANLLHRFSTEVTRAIEDYCHHHDYHVIICNTDEDPSKEKKYVEMLIAKQVDGLIIVPTCNNMELYQRFVDDHYPVVFLDRKMEGLPLPTVVMDNIGSSYICTSHLIAHGHRKIAIMTPPRHISSRAERIEGYEAALRDHGIPIRPEFIKSTRIDEAIPELARMLALEDRPTALLAGNDLILMEVLSYMMENGIRFPEDIALVLIDDVNFTDFLPSPLTTFEHPVGRMGRKAAEMLLDQIKSGQTTASPDSQLVVFKGSLQVRKSCGGPLPEPLTLDMLGEEEDGTDPNERQSDEGSL
jgi:LacI family kdg operon repressor